MLQARIARGHADDLVVAALLVGHPEHADRAAADQAAGERGLFHQYQRVKRVAVLAEGVQHEAVVGRVLGRGEQPAVQPDPAGFVVDLILVPAAPRDLDQDVEFHGAPVPFRGVLHAKPGVKLRITCGQDEDGALCRACGTTVVPPYQRPRAGLIPGTDDHLADRPDNDHVTNLAKNLTDTTRAHAGRVTVRVDSAAMTYPALDEARARVAGLLRERGFEPGDRIGVMMPNVAEVPVVYYGVLRAGGVVVPMNPLLKAREVAYYLGDSGAGLVFAWHSFAEQARGGADQVEAESIVVDGVSFPALLASATPDYQVADTSPAARPCRSRCSAGSRRRSASRCSRDTVFRKPRRSPPSTTPTGSTSPARSARPSGTCVCASSTARATRSGGARSARSSSTDRT